MCQGLPDQCFICRHFGLLGKDCPQKRYRSYEAYKLTSRVGKSDWTPVVVKHTFKHLNSPVNSIFLLDAPKTTSTVKEIPSQVPNKGNQLRDKGKQILQSLPHPVTRDKGRQIDCSGVVMDCEK